MAELRIALTETHGVDCGLGHNVAVLDGLSGEDLRQVRDANVAHNIDLIAQAQAAGAQLICLHELCTGPYFTLNRHSSWQSLAEPLQGDGSVEIFRGVAERLGVVLVVPFYERDPRTDRRYGSAAVIDADGVLLGAYRKTHIPDGKNEQGEFHERFYYGAADGPAPILQPARVATGNAYFPVFHTAVGRIGVSICYDRHFEGVHRTLSNQGAQLIVSPAVTFGAESERMWELEFEVDAMRHRVFIAGSNRLGQEDPWAHNYFGRSYVAGPDGRVDVDRSIEGLVFADVDLSAVSGGASSGWTLGADKRPDIYD